MSIHHILKELGLEIYSKTFSDRLIDEAALRLLVKNGVKAAASFKEIVPKVNNLIILKKKNLHINVNFFRWQIEASCVIGLKATLLIAYRNQKTQL